MPSGNFNVVTTPTGTSLTINQFYSTPPSTPGNVGVCLSGGGSRALTAAMGQLQGLRYLTVNGQSLLGQVKALSTVSGGSWLGVPFIFLPANSASDDAYLNTYVADQGQLTIAQLGVLPAGNAGQPLNSVLFSPELMALEAYILYKFMNVPSNMLWQTVIAVNILSAHNLFTPGTNHAPTDLFSYDAASLAAGVTGPNPSLASEEAFLFADAVSSSRTQRPFLICNMGMFVNQGNAVQLLAPVQANAFFTGILGSPSGTDANGLAPGGGGVASFGFDSTYVSAGVVNQTRQWSLTDIVGTSSAFFAETLEDQIAEWEQNPLELAALLVKYFEEILKWIEGHLPFHIHAPAASLVRLAAGSPELLGEVKADLGELTDLNPAYQYWPVANPQVVSNPQPTQFADGGSLENSGIGGMLAYSDIDSIISFINTSVPITAGEYGISDGQGGWLSGTYVVVDESIPPLFGYQPYESGQLGQFNKGYVLYKGAANTNYPMYANSQVFPSSAFAAFLHALWTNSGSGQNKHSAIVQQSLQIVPNHWFGITRSDTVNVVFCYLNMVEDWYHLFDNNPTVQQLISSYVSQYSFPNYDLLDTDLSATQTNLMANFTAWNVVSNSAIFKKLFGASQAARSGT